MSEQEKKELIQDFIKLLKSASDSHHSVNLMVEFLGKTLRNRSFIPPTAELITIIKYQKPILFQHLKKAISPTSILYFIIQLDMNYTTALERLDISLDALDSASNNN